MAEYFSPANRAPLTRALEQRFTDQAPMLTPDEAVKVLRYVVKAVGFHITFLTKFD